MWKKQIKQIKQNGFRLVGKNQSNESGRITNFQRTRNGVIERINIDTSSDELFCALKKKGLKLDVDNLAHWDKPNYTESKAIDTVEDCIAWLNHNTLNVVDN